MMAHKRIIFRLVLILSLAFNAAAVIHFMKIPAGKSLTPAVTSKKPILKLTDEQKRQLEPVRRDFYKRNLDIKKDITACQRKLLAALDKKPVDKTEVTKCIENISNLQKQIQLNTVDEIIRMKKHLNPNQCTCMIRNLGHAMDQSNQPCSCTHCNEGKKE